jgi:hypothetical protein
MLALELDSHTHDELVALMATAIESMHSQQFLSPEQAQEAPVDKPSTTALQNPRRALEPQGDRLLEAIFAETGQQELGEPAASVYHDGSSQDFGIHRRRDG